MRTIEQVLRHVPRGNVKEALPAPRYQPPGKPTGVGIALAVESMQRHTTDEGWQIMAGLQHAGYALAGNNLTINTTDIAQLTRRLIADTIVVQDKREWDPAIRDFRERADSFHNIHALQERSDFFKLTILKDAQQRNSYHRWSAEEIGVHGWIVYYHPTIVKHLAPYIRLEHTVRTYHTIDPSLVPPYSPEGRKGCLLSGAVSHAYPLRMVLSRFYRKYPEITYLRHPGYHRNGTNTPGYLKELGKYKVAICTSSIYGYSLRKIIEATACGCRVITDLPVDEVLPAIDENLVRINSSIIRNNLSELLRSLYAQYDPEFQSAMAENALAFYDYRVRGLQLAADIEQLRSSYEPRTSNS